MIAQGVRGSLSFRGAPLAGAVVYAYRRDAGGLLGPADFASAPTGRDGRYAIDLVEGSYHLVARRRQAGGDAGPVSIGDLQRVHPANPVAVLPGRVTSADFELEEVRDLRFARGAGRVGEGATGVRGRIVDASGRPVPWVFAIAFSTADMRRVPDQVSSMTADDGRYVLRLPRGGRWWVGAPAHIRERPAEGEPFGLFAGSPDHSVEVAEGAFLDGVDIVVGPFRRDGAPSGGE